MDSPGWLTAFSTRRITLWVFVLAAVDLVAHLATAGHYPLHQDELYYIVCGRHPAWSYPDHAPLAPMLAALMDHVFGVSAFWLRVWPALVGAVLVCLAGWMAQRLGGGRLAQVLAAMAVLLSPLFLMTGTLMQTVFLDQLFWTLSAVVLLAILSGADRRLYLLLGLVLGLGILAKLTMLAWGFSILVGLLLTRQRDQLRSRWLWLGAVIAAVCATPVLLWQAQHGWPVLDFIANSKAKTAPTTLGFFKAQVGMSGPVVGTVLLILGFTYLLGGGDNRRWRVLGVAVVIAWLVFLFSGGKGYYAGATYPLLFAGGAVQAERMLSRMRSSAWKVVTVILLGAQVWMVPYFLSVMSPEQVAERLDRIPHDDWQAMFGWPEIATQTAAVYDSLSTDEQAGLRVLTDNYGLAAAIDLYGQSMGLPAAISGHNGYAFWDESPDLDPLIVIGYDPETFRQYYSEVREFGVIRGSDIIPSDDEGGPIFYCRGLNAPASEAWKVLRHFD